MDNKEITFMDKIGSVLSSVKQGVTAPWMIVLNFISNLIDHYVDKLKDKRIPLIIAFAIIQFEKEIRDFVKKSDTPIDDKVVDELIESAHNLMDDISGYISC